MFCNVAHINPWVMGHDSWVRDHADSTVMLSSWSSIFDVLYIHFNQFSKYAPNSVLVLHDRFASWFGPTHASFWAVLKAFKASKLVHLLLISFLPRELDETVMAPASAVCFKEQLSMWEWPPPARNCKYSMQIWTLALTVTRCILGTMSQ